jgi:hypothetical protein
MDVLEQNRPSRNDQFITVSNRHTSSIVTITLTNDDNFDVTRTISISGRLKIEAHPATIGRVQFHRLHDRFLITPENEGDPASSYFDFRFDANNTGVSGLSIGESDAEHVLSVHSDEVASGVASGSWLNGYLIWIYRDISVPAHSSTSVNFTIGHANPFRAVLFDIYDDIANDNYISCHIDYGRDEMECDMGNDRYCKLGSDDTQWDCYTDHHIAWWIDIFLWLALASPNIIIPIVTKCCCKRAMPPISVFVFSYLGNFCYSLVFFHLADARDPPWYAVIIAAVLWLVIQMPGICRKCGLRNCQVIRQLSAEIARTDEGEEILANNFCAYPVLTVYVKAHHRESRQTCEEKQSYQVAVHATETFYIEDGDGTRHYKDRDIITGYETHWEHFKTHFSEWKRVDQGGGKLAFIPCQGGHSLDPVETEFRTVIVWEDHREYRYETWCEAGEAVEFPDCDVVTVYNNYAVPRTDSAKAALAALERELYNAGLDHDTEVTVDTRGTVPDLESTFYLSLKDERVQCVECFFARWFGRIVWFLVLLLGYQCSYECFCNLGFSVNGIVGNEIEVSCKKWISDEHDLRAQYREADPEGAVEIRKSFAVYHIEEAFDQFPKYGAEPEAGEAPEPPDTSPYGAPYAPPEANPDGAPYAPPETGPYAPPYAPPETGSYAPPATGPYAPPDPPPA